MNDAYEIAKRFSYIRPMLDGKITNSEYVIGTYIMTILCMIGEGLTNEEIVDATAKHGVDKRPEWR